MIIVTGTSEPCSLLHLQASDACSHTQYGVVNAGCRCRSHLSWYYSRLMVIDEWLMINESMYLPL